MSRSLLDHVYNRQDIPKQVNSDVVSIYFSDHDVIKFKLFQSLQIVETS